MFAFIVSPVLYVPVAMVVAGVVAYSIRGLIRRKLQAGGKLLQQDVQKAGSAVSSVAKKI